MTPIQLKFYRRIDEVLFYKWDPIGISDGAWARDEYHAYLPNVFSYAMEGKSSNSIAEYLGTVAVESMGLSPISSHDQKIARLIIEIKEELGL